jgi:hypothetical protein
MKNMLDELKKLNKDVEVPEGFSKKVINEIKHVQKKNYKAILSTLSFAAVIVIAVLFVDYYNNNKTNIPENNIEQAMDYNENEYKESKINLDSINKTVGITAIMEKDESTKNFEQNSVDTRGNMTLEIKDLLEINGFSIIESNENKVVVAGDLETVKSILIDFSAQIIQKGDNIEIIIK